MPADAYILLPNSAVSVCCYSLLGCCVDPGSVPLAAVPAAQPAPEPA